ncbi:MAG: hypothetical protein ACM3X1_05880, partial [Ignavibacteriales bacterium]
VSYFLRNKDGSRQHVCILLISVVFILFFCDTTILDVNNYVSASPASSDRRSVKNLPPFLPPFSTFDERLQADDAANLISNIGSITVKKVKVGTSEHLGNATLMFTPNPHTLKESKCDR